ncbi:unnamed protein product [Soboliphyme baturini]|uniref:non-specific serine/threonine protein kinase n=1 Tax=Soboliphyme baturini TaxID=241478 RepID=A0A183ID73_9BILA|nr:unnamed protein product [Soboliphyme baturini]
MTLREYLLLYKPDPLAGVVLYGQLLESLLYLSKCRVAHRDLKSNNILVSFDNEQEPPHLVLCDFGSCLSVGSFTVRCTSENVDLGGNVALRAPEIACAKLDGNSVLNYEKADLWASGTIAYEIFTTINPFYALPPVGLSSETYREEELPELGTEIPWHVRMLVRRVLARDPCERPSVACVANLLVLTLFRAESIWNCLQKLQLLRHASSLRLMLSQAQCTVADLVNLFAVETILSRHVNRLKLSGAECQLRQTFFSRLEVSSLVEEATFLLNLMPLRQSVVVGHSMT